MDVPQGFLLITDRLLKAEHCNGPVASAGRQTRTSPASHQRSLQTEERTYLRNRVIKFALQRGSASGELQKLCRQQHLPGICGPVCGFQMKHGYCNTSGAIGNGLQTADTRSGSAGNVQAKITGMMEEWGISSRDTAEIHLQIASEAIAPTEQQQNSSKAAGASFETLNCIFMNTFRSPCRH